MSGLATIEAQPLPALVLAFLLVSSLEIHKFCLESLQYLILIGEHGAELGNLCCSRSHKVVCGRSVAGGMLESICSRCLLKRSQGKQSRMAGKVKVEGESRRRQVISKQIQTGD